MTQSEAFERQLNRTTDATPLRGKLLVTLAVTASPAALLSFTPANMGVRAGALANIFTHYRFKYVKIKWTSLSVTNAITALGVYDDASVNEGQAPTSVSGIAEMRASSTQLGNSTVPQYFEWVPVDTKQWEYTVAGVTGSDIRLETSGILYAASTASNSVCIEVDYCIVFKGAADVGAT
jgi:hypothetical protein